MPKKAFMYTTLCVCHLSFLLALFFIYKDQFNYLIIIRFSISNSTKIVKGLFDKNGMFIEHTKEAPFTGTLFLIDVIYGIAASP